jgi:purine-binding chemotaxis protein CheW
VVEVVMMAKLTPMPESPEWVAGLLNCRGQTIPVIDVLARLTRAAHRPSLSDVVVICSVAGRRFGLIVQEILSVDTVPPRSVQPPSPETEHAPYLLGVIQLAQQMILLFSVAALLDVASSSGANG